MDSFLNIFMSWRTMIWVFTFASSIQCGFGALTPIDDSNIRTAVKAYMADKALAVSTYGNIESWNTSRVTDLSYLFSELSNFNEDISRWNTSSVTTMKSLFNSAVSFDRNIGNWDTGKVTDFSYMFSEARSFNQNIGSWNTSSATIMEAMFYSAVSFDQNIGNWKTERVTTMKSMFSSADRFDQNIESWNTSSVTTMKAMFNSAERFNQNIGNWDTGGVTDFGYMFSGAQSFNQNIEKWDTGKVTDFSHMFSNAKKFDQSIGKWDTGKVADFSFMFRNAKNFNQNIADWVVYSAVAFQGMFLDTNYNKEICWDINPWATGTENLPKNRFPDCDASDELNSDTNMITSVVASTSAVLVTVFAAWFIFIIRRKKYSQDSSFDLENIHIPVADFAPQEDGNHEIDHASVAEFAVALNPSFEENHDELDVSGLITAERVTISDDDL